MIKNLLHNKELIISFAKRTLIGKYRGSVLGIFWSFANPLFLLLVYTIVFSFMFKIRPRGGFPYSLFLFSGMVPWLAFSEAVNQSVGVIRQNLNLVKKTIFPLEILPVSMTIVGFIHGLFSLIILLIGILVVEHKLYPTVLLLPIVMIPQLIFTTGLCWFLASLAVFIMDMKHIMGIVLIAWMYMTPIIYPVEMIPERFRLLWMINPMYGIVDGYRNLLLYGRLPGGKLLLICTFLGIILFCLGYVWFMKTKKGFAEVV